MGLTQRQFSFSNYEAIKRMRAVSALNTFPNKLAQGSITVQTSTKVPLETPLHSPVKVSGLIAFFLAARKFVKQECENWNCQDCNKKQAHVTILRKHQGLAFQLLSWVKENTGPWLERNET